MLVLILSGIPGSGKSHYARSIQNVRIFSADKFFKQNGQYVYSRSKLPEAHKWCFRHYATFLVTKSAEDTGTVIVDNTNCTAVEIAPYYTLAEAFGHSAKVVRIACDPRTAFARQTHNVPQETFERMLVRFSKRDVLQRWYVEEIRG